jgi:hypothetical protein
MGDDLLPADQRVTQTNIEVEKQGKFKWNLEDSGLLGPVRIVTMSRAENVALKTERETAATHEE